MGGRCESRTPRTASRLQSHLGGVRARVRARVRVGSGLGSGLGLGLGWGWVQGWVQGWVGVGYRGRRVVVHRAGGLTAILTRTLTPAHFSQKYCASPVSCSSLWRSRSAETTSGGSSPTWRGVGPGSASLARLASS